MHNQYRRNDTNKNKKGTFVSTTTPLRADITTRLLTTFQICRFSKTSRCNQIQETTNYILPYVFKHPFNSNERIIPRTRTSDSDDKFVKPFKSTIPQNVPSQESEMERANTATNISSEQNKRPAAILELPTELLTPIIEALELPREEETLGE